MISRSKWGQGRRRGLGRRLALAILSATMVLPVAQAADEGLDEVVVSARKRTERAHDVPISLSEISGSDLQQRGLARVQDIVRAMPNVSMDILTPRQASLAIRGIGRNPANDALESSVGVFLDGVYLGRPGMMVTDLVDLERLEVLRGPQGALFGKNATAGVLNILSARPSSQTGGWLQLSAGDYAMRELRGAATGPLGDTSLAYRFSGFATARDGFIHDTVRDQQLGGLRRAGGRGQLEWRDGETASIRLIADYASQDEDGPGYLLVDPNYYRVDGSIRTNSLVTRGARLGYTPDFPPSGRRNDADAYQHVDTRNAGATLLADWNVAGLRLSSITGWRTFSFLPENDGDYSALDVLPQLGTNVHSRQFSEELRLASPAQGAFQYLGGLQYFQQQVQSDVFAVYGSQASAYLYPGLPADVLDGFRVVTNANPDTHSYSAFGQVYWWPRADLEIAAGVRWTTEDKSAVVEQHTGGGASPAPADTAALQARQRLGSEQGYAISSNEDFVSGSVSATWHVDEQVNVYLSAARGAKSGGVNAAILPPGADRTVGPETALGYELGIKTRLFDERLELDASTFLTTIEDYQASIRDLVVGASYLANAGEVRSSGAEMQAIYRPVAALTLSAAVGYNDAHYASFHQAVCPAELDNLPSCDFSGERVAGAPPLTYSAAFDFNTKGIGSFTLRTLVEYTHADGYRAELSRSSWAPAQDLVNFRATLGNAAGNRALTFWMLNAFDDQYYTGMAVVGPGGTGVAIGLPGTPRTLGLSLELRY